MHRQKNNALALKKEILATRLRNLDSLAVAFSGGADSTLLLAVAAEIFQEKSDPHKLLAITLVSPIHFRKEISAARLFAAEKHIHHILIESGEMESPSFIENLANRCYVCKKIIFDRICREAGKFGIFNVAHGLNSDDQRDYRPGMKAADEMNVLSPLLDAGLTKADIRQLSRKMGLRTWNKPASGCLATRIPYGEPIDLKKLRMIEASEMILWEQGLAQCRVRHYGELAKIEIPFEDFEKLLNPGVREHIIHELKAIGFLYISIDIEGYQSGRLNRSVLQISSEAR